MLDELQHWLTPLMLRVAPAERSKLARTVAQEVRRSQQQRILAQRNADGSAYAPRKKRDLRGQSGRIRRKAKMFTKLRTSRFLKAQGNATAATISFAGRISRIARVHQEGLRDRPARGGRAVQYAKRELLGLTDAERERIRDLVLQHLTL